MVVGGGGWMVAILLLVGRGEWMIARWGQVDDCEVVVRGGERTVDGGGSWSGLLMVVARGGEWRLEMCGVDCITARCGRTAFRRTVRPLTMHLSARIRYATH